MASAFVFLGAFFAFAGGFDAESGEHAGYALLGLAALLFLLGFAIHSSDRADSAKGDAKHETLNSRE